MHKRFAVHAYQDQDKGLLAKSYAVRCSGVLAQLVSNNIRQEGRERSAWTNASISKYLPNIVISELIERIEVGSHCPSEEYGFLRDDTKLEAEVMETNSSYINTIYEDSSTSWLNQSKQCTD